MSRRPRKRLPMKHTMDFVMEASAFRLGAPKGHDTSLRGPTMLNTGNAVTRDAVHSYDSDRNILHTTKGVRSLSVHIGDMLTRYCVKDQIAGDASHMDLH